MTEPIPITLEEIEENFDEILDRAISGEVFLITDFDVILSPANWQPQNHDD